MTPKNRFLGPVALAAAFMAAAPVSAQSASPKSASTSMESLEWTYRPILVLAPSTDDPSLRDISIVLRQSRDALADREVMVISVAGDTVSTWDPALDRPSGLSFDARQLRQAYGRDNDAVLIVLVGKDGGIKKSGKTPGDIQDMIDLIDTMPMRQRELDMRAREADRREEIENRMWGDETFGR